MRRRPGFPRGLALVFAIAIGAAAAWPAQDRLVADARAQNGPPQAEIADIVIDEGTGETINQDPAADSPDAAADAPTVPLEAFYGDWTGTGVAEDQDLAFFALMERDLDVQIVAVDGGFQVSWQTLIRSGEDTSDPERRLRVASLVFEPGDRPHLFRARSSGDLLAGETVSWARLHGQTLSVYQMTLNAQGGHELLIFDRQFEDLDDPDRLTVVFRRLTDGELIRVVRGRLSRDPAID